MERNPDKSRTEAAIIVESTRRFNDFGSFLNFLAVEAQCSNATELAMGLHVADVETVTSWYANKHRPTRRHFISLKDFFIDQKVSSAKGEDGVP